MKEKIHTQKPYEILLGDHQASSYEHKMSLSGTNKVKNASHNEMILCVGLSTSGFPSCVFGERFGLKDSLCCNYRGPQYRKKSILGGHNLDFPKQNLGHAYRISYCNMTNLLNVLQVAMITRSLAAKKCVQLHLHLETRSPSCHVLKIQPAVSHTILNPSFQSGISEGIPSISKIEESEYASCTS